jgi:hypothetical protein
METVPDLLANKEIKKDAQRVELGRPPVLLGILFI